MDQRLHDIDDDSSDGDVEPDRKGITGKTLVRRKAACQRKKKRDENEWKRNGREEDVRGEQLPVEGPPCAETVEAGFAVESEVHQVRAEEDGGEEKRRKHCGAVLRNAPRADEAVAEEQRDGRERIQNCVDQGKGTEMRVAEVRGRVEINQPADEGAGQHADGDDSDDHRWRRTQVIARGQRALGRRSHRRHLEEEASFGVQHQGSHQQRKIDN